jgi:hypothetical protein
MLTARAYIALAVLVALALVSWAWLHERDVSAGLRRDLEVAAQQREADVQAVRDAQARASAEAGRAAQACGLEGSAAFNRGVEVGRAVCEARRP